MRNFSFFCLFAWGAFVGACGDGDAKAGARPETAPLVDVATATQGALKRTRTYHGLTRSKARAELSPAEPGMVLEVLVREGDRVALGETLLRVDPDLARAQLRSARAARKQVNTQREQASKEAERFKAAGSRAVSTVEIERATAEAEALNAQGESLEAAEVSAKVTLNRHRITAPFAGVISERLVDPGDWVTPGTRALELVADDQMEVLVSVDPDLLQDVKEGLMVTIVRGQRSVPGRLVGVVRALDPVTRTAQLRVVPTETSPWLIPGLAVNVRFEIAREGEGVLVPNDALIADMAETRVVKVVDGKAQPVVVSVVDKGEAQARVRSKDLRVGDTVVTRGNERLRPNQPVKVAEK